MSVFLSNMCGISKNFNILYCNAGRDISNGIATRYGLAGLGIESRWEKGFSAPVQTGSGAHPACYTRCTSSFMVIQRWGRGLDYTPSSAEVKERVEIFLESPSGPR